MQQNQTDLIITVTNIMELGVTRMPHIIQAQRLLANRTDTILIKPQGENLSPTSLGP